MKILYFHQHFTTPDLSGGTRSYEFAKRLIERGHSVTLVCGETAKLNLPKTEKHHIHRGVIDEIDVIQIVLPYSNKDGIAKRALTFMKFGWFGVKIALKEEYDLLFATSTPLTAGIPGILMKLFRRKKFVFEVRDLWPELPKALGLKNPFLLWGMSLLERLSYRFADACIGLSPGICEGIREKTSKDKHISMIPNGCDLNIFKRTSEKTILEGIKEQDKVAVFTGAHGIANGLDAIVNVAVYLKKIERNDIIFAFIGDGKVKSHLIERVKNEGLKNCKFYSPLPKMELNKVMSSVSVGMMVLANIPAFYYGTSPNKFFDYISSGLPVINNYPGWLADMINTHNLGVVVPPDDPKVFAEGLIEIIDNDELWKKQSRNARKFAEDNFSREKLADEFVVFLESIL